MALEQFIAHRVATLANLLAVDAARLLARRFGLALREWRILAVLGDGRPLSAAEVSRRTVIDKGRVGRALANLVRRGLLERESDPFDARRMSVRLSLKGRALYRRVVPLASARERMLLAGVSPAERRELERLLARLQQRAAALVAAVGIPDETDGED